MARSENARGSRLKLVGGIGLIGLLVAAIAVYFVFFRDNAAESVNSVAGEEARQAAIEEAAASESDEQPTDTDDSDENEDEGETALDSGQPDSAASVGAATDGVWTVDTSIGTFDVDECLTGACGSTFAGFRINEELAGFGAKTVVGRTPDVSGSMELVGAQVIGGSFTVDMTTLVTDDPGRTSALKSTAGGLETNNFPTAVFELTQPIDLGEIPAEGAPVEVQAVGNLTVHGVTRPVTIPLTAEVQAGLIIVFGNLEGMLLSDYDIPTPSALVVVSVEDNATLELQLFLSR